MGDGYGIGGVNGMIWKPKKEDHKLTNISGEILVEK